MKKIFLYIIAIAMLFILGCTTKTVLTPQPSAFPTPLNAVGNSGLTSGQVPFANSSNSILSSPNMSYVDAGGGTLTTTNFNGIANSCLHNGNSGSSFPSSPTAGDFFLHNPTGCTILYQYGGSSWNPLYQYQSANVYVDNVNGTNDLLHGYGPGTSAWQSIAYAVQQCPALTNVNVPTGNSYTINLTSGQTYTENLFIAGKLINNAGNVIILSPQNVLTTKTATGGTIGSGANVPTITEAGGTFTANQYNGDFVQFTSGSNNNITRVIGVTSTSTLYLIGQALAAAPVNGDTYRIFNTGATIDGYVYSYKNDVYIYNTQVTYSNAGGLPGVVYAYDGNATVINSRIQSTASIASLYADSRGEAYSIASSLESTASSAVGVESEWGGCIDVENSRVIGYSNTQGNGIQTNRGGQAYILACDVSVFNVGLYSTSNGTLDTFPVSVNTFVHGCGYYGAYTNLHGCITETGSSVTFAKKVDGTTDANSTNTGAESASYSYLN